jgi:energy-coupling factor transporter ATP-binding protein EcfA2
MSQRVADAQTATPPAVPVPAAVAPARLEVLEQLFRRLDAEQIRYCHWKSNEHLGATMTGATDVDVLVERRGVQRLTHILTAETSFKRFVVKAGRGYPGIEDYVGFDPATGKLSHLHVHYQLTLGEKFLKGHRLPWEEAVLDSRVRDESSGLWITDPHLELLILIVRHVMKLRLRDSALAALGHDYFRGGMLRELRWLAARVRSDQLVARAEPLVGPIAARLLPGMIAGRGPSIRQLRAFRRRAAPRLSSYRMYSAAGATRRMWLREWTWIWWRLKNLVFRAPTKSTRTPPQGGLAIAFVGPDGAGKSTLTRAIADWLAREIAVTLTYGGSGKGSASALRRWLQRLGAYTRPKRAPNTGAPTAPDAPSGVRLLGKLLWVLTLARERRRWATQVRRARSLGMVVLSDRLPQTQFAGLNDGPRYGHWLDSPSWLRRTVARREQATFREAGIVPPDVVVRLRVPVDVAAQRKPDTPLDQLRRKVEIVDQLHFPPPTRVVEINAALPLDRVLGDVKQAVWSSL